MKTNALILLLLLTLFSCEKEFPEPDDIRQEILFKVEYVNYAWGHTHNGIIIGRDGLVYEFSLPDSWNYPDTNGIISADALGENLALSLPGSDTLDPEVLLLYLNKLYKVDPEDLTESETQCYDCGATLFSGYFYDEATEDYQEVLLRETGSVYIENRSVQAKQISEWLSTIIND